MFEHLNKSQIPNPYGDGVLDLAELNFEEIHEIFIFIKKQPTTSVVEYIWEKVLNALNNHSKGINFLSKNQ